jgi:hypothetical protein
VMRAGAELLTRGCGRTARHALTSICTLTLLRSLRNDAFTTPRVRRSRDVCALV